MDYTKLLNRAFNMVWAHKFLIILGALVALGSGSPSNQASWRVSGENDGGFNVDFTNFPILNEEMFPNYAIPIIISAILVVVAIVIAIWVISLIARGGLIASVDALETGETSSFIHAWNAGRKRVSGLVGIGLTPLIPMIVFLGVLLLGGGFFATLNAITNSNADVPLIAGISSVVLVGACIAIPLTIGLSGLRVFAERAYMLEGLDIYNAYRRGWEVAVSNLADVMLLFVLQVAISVGLFITLLVPGVVMALCFLLWPVLLLMFGAVAAYFSTLWTLAWREWTGVGAISSVDDPINIGGMDAGAVPLSS